MKLLIAEIYNYITSSIWRICHKLPYNRPLRHFGTVVWIKGHNYLLNTIGQKVFKHAKPIGWRGWNLDVEGENYVVLIRTLEEFKKLVK